MALLAGPRSAAPAEAGPPRVFIFGLGYTGSAIGRALAATHGCAVVGTRRSAADELNGVVTFDDASGLCAAGRDALARATHVLSTIAPSPSGADPVLEQLGPLLRAQIGLGRLRWVGYLSSTSVYGDHGGAWVDESSPARASPGSSAHARLAVEALWLELAAQPAGAQAPGGEKAARAAVFRLAGIYGPGRSALNTALRARAEACGEERPGAEPGGANPTSRAHVDDIAGAVGAALVARAAGTFNVADHQPASRAEVLAFCEQLLQPPPAASRPAWQGAGPQPAGSAPARAAGALSERAGRRGRESKRVSGERLRRELGYAFVHPGYVSGLTAIHAAGAFGAAPDS